MSEKHKYVWDIETFPNYSSYGFKNIDTGERHTFIVFADRQANGESFNELPELLDFVNRRVSWLVGYNSIEYDDNMLAYILMHAERLRKSTPQVITQELYKLSSEIIGYQRMKKTAPAVYGIQKYVIKPWRSLDLLLQYNPIDRTGLKQLAIGLKWPVLADLPYKPDHIVLAHEIPIIADYNENDIDITEKLMIHLSKKINLRIAYTKKYKVDIINSCNSDIAKKLIGDYYEKVTDTPFREFSKKRTEYAKLPLAECISPHISFETREYNRALQKIKDTVIDPNKKETKGTKGKKQFEHILRSKYVTHTMGLGGIHSNNPPEILTECEKYAYIDIDAASFYPWILILNRLYPAHLGEAFVDIYKRYIVEERMRIKHDDPVLAYMLKIAANATFGLTKSKFSWLYDPKLTTFICISGQLYLLMLMEALERYSHSVVVYSNTDGLTVRVRRDEIALFHKICKQWETRTGFILEYKWYEKMIIRDVNNFIMFTYDKGKDRIKAKGAYLYGKEEHKSIRYPILSKAVMRYYETGKPVEETILEEKSIYEFMAAEKTSQEKYEVSLTPVRHKGNPIALQKHNRWIVTKGNLNEGKLRKASLQDFTNKKGILIPAGTVTEMEKDYTVTCLNDVVDNVPMVQYMLNYDFYIEEALKMVHVTKVLNKSTHVTDNFVQQQLEFA